MVIVTDFDSPGSTYTFWNPTSRLGGLSLHGDPDIYLHYLSASHGARVGHRCGHGNPRIRTVGVWLVSALGRHQACHEHYHVGFRGRILGLVQVGKIVGDGHLRHGRGSAEVPQHILHAFQRRHGV